MQKFEIWAILLNSEGIKPELAEKVGKMIENITNDNLEIKTTQLETKIAHLLGTADEWTTPSAWNYLKPRRKRNFKQNTSMEVALTRPRKRARLECENLTLTEPCKIQ